MTGIHSYQEARRLLRERTGIVLPVHIPKAAGELGERLLEDTARACADQLDDPRRICLSVDGEKFGSATALTLSERHGYRVEVSERNRGKLSGVRAGMQLLHQDADLDYFVVVDADGDHFANEILNLVRAARHIAMETGESAVHVLGCRHSRHRPLGFLRGELEELCDRVLLDALAFWAAQRGTPLRLEYATALEEFPDFHSGFKLFTRGLVEETFLKDPVLCGVDEDAYYRHAVEAVMTVEALLAGGVLGVVRRSTFDEQPVSAFGLLERCRLAADKMIWPCKRLGVPGPFVRQWLTHHAVRLELGSLTPMGREELLEIRRLVCEAFGLVPGESDDTLPGPLFV